MAKTIICKQCDSERYIIDISKSIAIAARCKACFRSCPTCDNEGVIWSTDKNGYSMVAPCEDCGILDLRIQKFNKAKIPSRYCRPEFGGTLALYRNLCYQYANNTGPIGNLNLVHRTLYQWAENFVPGEKGLLLHGSVGTGKTHLLAITLRQLTIEKGITCQFIEFTHLLSQLKEQYDRGLGESAVLGPLSKIDVLAIDELGKGRRTDWELSILDELISKRYNRGGTTLFTTNFGIHAPKTQEEAKLTQTLRERVGDRIFSRLHEMTDFVEVVAPDFRKPV